jgi:hypothetical protein
MANPTTFGRRATFQHQASRAVAKRDLPQTNEPLVSGQDMVDHPLSTQGQLAWAHIDHELEEWKQARKQQSRIPWPQLYLMASLCFGTASLVLPDSINDNLDWLLYGLMAASGYAGFSKWLRTK